MLRNTLKTTELLAGLGGLMVAIGSMFGRGGALIGLGLGRGQRTGARGPGLDLTQRPAGASGGLLVDLGFHLCPIGEISNGMLPAALLVWIAGDSTTPEGRQQLTDFGVPWALGRAVRRRHRGMGAPRA